MNQAAAAVNNIFVLRPIRRNMTVRLAILFLLIGTSMGWSQRVHKPKDTLVAEGSHVPAESKLSPRYSHGHKPRSGYILEEEDHPDHLGGHHGQDYVDNEEHTSHKEQDEAVGNEELDKTVKDDEYDDHAEKGGHKRFEAGGASYDKHLKDHKADNKEIENVKEHDIGEKFGGEARKEHKVGKNKEKSKGHKLHGFKNVYHKEEYGDHKTFHDEFLDSDHQNNYDDHHEHQEMHGGKFSKGFKHEGKNDKYDKGDEKREWGEQEFDSNHEGKHEKGGQLSKHRHGNKKHHGQYDASYQKNKNAVHKTKKGNPPPHTYHAGHHGPHQAQIQPYVSHHTSHHDHVPSHHSHHPRPHHHEHSQHVHYDDERDHGHSGHNHHHPESHSSNQHDSHAHNHGGHGIHSHSDSYSQDEVDNDDYHQERTPQHHHHKSLAKDQIDDRIEDKVSHKLQPTEHKLPVSSHFGTQGYRQPVYQDHSHSKQPESLKQEKFSDPFDERSHNTDHKIKYGYQPRNHPHHSHHQPQHQQHHQPQQKHQEQQPFLRFPGFHHQHRAHDRTHHTHHGGHDRHIRPLSSHHQQVPTTDVDARKPDHTGTKLRDEVHRRFSQKRYE